MIPAFLFSQLSVSSHYLGVNWAYWRKPYTSQPLYLSHFIYPNSSLSGTFVRNFPSSSVEHSGAVWKTISESFKNPPNSVETHESVVIHMSSPGTNKSQWCIVQICPNASIRIHITQ